MALVDLTVAVLDGGLVTIACQYDDATLRIDNVSWDNGSGAQYLVVWDAASIKLPTGSGTHTFRKNENYMLVPDPDDGFAFGFPVEAHRG